MALIKTGIKRYGTLVQYSSLTGLPTGVTKPNQVGDPDYVPPVLDLYLCGEEVILPNNGFFIVRNDLISLQDIDSANYNVPPYDYGGDIIEITISPNITNLIVGNLSVGNQEVISYSLPTILTNINFKIDNTYVRDLSLPITCKHESPANNTANVYSFNPISFPTVLTINTIITNGDIFKFSN